MLVLSRRCRESVVLPADGVVIRVLEIRANRVRLGIEAPTGVSVLRGELLGREADDGPRQTRPLSRRPVRASAPSQSWTVEAECAPYEKEECAVGAGG